MILSAAKAELVQCMERPVKLDVFSEPSVAVFRTAQVFRL